MARAVGLASCVLLLRERRVRCELYRQGGDDPEKVLQWHREGGGFLHDGIKAVQLPGKGWALCVKHEGIPAGTVLVRTLAFQLWTAHDAKAKPSPALAPGEAFPSASAELRRRLVTSKVDPFVGSMQPPEGMPLRQVAGRYDQEKVTAKGLRGTSLLHHTLSLRAKLRSAVQPELDAAEDKQRCWETCVWAQAVMMSRGFHLPKCSDRLALIPVVDIANHAPTYSLANAEFRDDPDGSVSMIASRGLVPFEEVCVCYGEHTNEQLLFCYGFVIPKNPCQGLLCPLEFPSGPKGAQLQRLLAEHRAAHGRNPMATAGPMLRRSDEAEPGCAELLLALTLEKELSCQELVMALSFLEAWRSELPDEGSELQQEAVQLIEAGMEELAAQLPWPLYIRYRCMTHPWQSFWRLLRREEA